MDAGTQITFTQMASLLAVAATFVTLLVFARNDGKREGRLQAMEKSVDDHVKSMDRKLDALQATVGGFIDTFNDIRGEHREWRGSMDEFRRRADEEIERQRNRYHNELAPQVQRAMALEPRVQRLEEARA